MKEQSKASESERRRKLTAEEYRVLREKATDPPFTGEYVNNKREGTYVCTGCGAVLFSSEAKYDSGSGWPSFFEPAAEDRIAERADESMGMIRTEILCANCGGHLGHLFDDGPQPTGLRYCVNSTALKFKENRKTNYTRR